ncbi:hypothetical protein C8R42DRAFT_683684 [Lentinula raphanica]|nr:hypothetical protein C8R42DRAFT_683684 [Lentinula raphanica]
MIFRRLESNPFEHDRCFINRLPIELLTQIFTECADPPSTRLTNEHGAPQLLLRVCKQWRDLAYATPSLWSSFEIHFGTWALNYNASEGDALALARMNLWLRQSGTHPLSVKLHYKPPISSLRHGSMLRFPMQALGLLLDHCSRWREIEFSMPNACLTPLIRQAPVLDFPLLNSLVLNPVPSIPSESLDLRCIASNCAQLTRLHINFEAGRALTLDDCCAILARHSNLNSCTLYAQCVYYGETSDVNKLMLPALSEFHLLVHDNSGYTTSVSSSPEAALTSFLDRLELYTLNSLHIEWLLDGDRKHWTTVHPSFVMFFETLKPTLETLCLGYLPLSEEQLIDCLRSVPYLTDLELLFSLGEDPEASPVVTDKVLRALTLSKPGPEAEGGQGYANLLLPMLRGLTLQCHGEGCSEKEFVRFVDSRTEEELLHALQTLKVHTQVPILREDASQFRWSNSRFKVIEICDLQ